MIALVTEMSTVLVFILFSQLWLPFESESEVTCGQVWWPILRICALHSVVPGSSWGFGALFKGLTSIVVLRWKEHWLFTHHDNSCLRFKPATFHYKHTVSTISEILVSRQSQSLSQSLWLNMTHITQFESTGFCTHFIIWKVRTCLIITVNL